MNWIGVVIVGMTIGLLGKLVAPKPFEDSPLWLTVACGVAGILVGWSVVGEGHPVMRWLASLGLSAVLVAVALTSTERDRTHA